MPTPAVGEDIDALCGKCGQVWHVVMAKVGDRIAKVVCKRCGGHHLYRSERPMEEAGGGGGRTGSSASGRAAPRRAAAARAEPTPAPLPPFDPSKPPRPYSARETFAIGDRINHPTFGVGVVAASPGPGKVEVGFPSGRRVLACAKAESHLERPTAATFVPIADRPPGKPNPLPED